MEPYLRKIKYYECDRMGVTHHSNYIRFMEEARIEMLDRLGYGFEKMEAEGMVSPVVSLTADFKRTTTFQDVISIEVGVLEISALKISFKYVMKKDGKVVFTGTSTHCFLCGGRPVVMEERFPELYAKFREMMAE